MVNIREVVSRNKKTGIAFVAGIALVFLFLAILPKGSSAARIQGGSGTPISFQQAVGSAAPDFSLQAINGSTVNLDNYRGKKTVILFFSEGAMCYPACWNQMASLAADQRFNNTGAIAFSIVVDPRSYWLGAINNASVPGLAKANLLFDTNANVSAAYDVLSLPSSMHPRSLPGHTYFIIDKSGVIRYTLDDPSMSIDNDKLASVLSAIG